AVALFRQPGRGTARLAIIRRLLAPGARCRRRLARLAANGLARRDVCDARRGAGGLWTHHGGSGGFGRLVPPRLDQDAMIEADRRPIGVPLAAFGRRPDPNGLNERTSSLRAKRSNPRGSFLGSLAPRVRDTRLLQVEFAFQAAAAFVGDEVVLVGLTDRGALDADEIEPEFGDIGFAGGGVGLQIGEE